MNFCLDLIGFRFSTLYNLGHGIETVQASAFSSINWGYLHLCSRIVGIRVNLYDAPIIDQS